jgi:hypothetical protein
MSASLGDSTALICWTAAPCLAIVAAPSELATDGEDDSGWRQRAGASPSSA